MAATAPPHFASRECGGAAHNEAYCDARLEDPLLYLLSSDGGAVTTPRS